MTAPFTDVSLITMRDALTNRTLLAGIVPPRVKISKRSIFKPTDQGDDVILSATKFREIYPEYTHLAGYVESDDFQYLSIEVGGFVLQIMRWV
jgi:hypothetical protein